VPTVPACVPAIKAAAYRVVVNVPCQLCASSCGAVIRLARRAARGSVNRGVGYVSLIFLL
jgi:hypothetical protein